MSRVAVIALALVLFGLALAIVGALLLRRAAKREAEGAALWSGVVREPWALADIKGFMRNK